MPYYCSIKFPTAERLTLFAAFISLLTYCVLYFYGAQQNVVNMGMEKEWSINGFIKTACSLAFTACTIYLYIKHSVKLNAMGKCFSVFCLYLIYFSIINPDNAAVSSRYLTNYVGMTLWMFVYYFFYLIFQKYNNVCSIRKWIVRLFLLLFVLFLFNYATVSEVHSTWHYIEAYFCVMMMPFVFLLVEGRWRSILISLVFVVVILSAKRAGTVACVASFLVFYYMKSPNVFHKLKTIVVVGIIAVILYIAASFFFGEELTFLVERFQGLSEDGGSGRDVVFAYVIDMILNSSNFDLYFGHGYNAVIQDNALPYSAHNDFLEVTYDFGLVGLVLYLWVYGAILAKLKYVKSRKAKAAVLSSFILMLVLSMTSHLILYTTSIVCLCAFWGYIDAQRSINQPV